MLKSATTPREYKEFFCGNMPPPPGLMPLKRHAMVSKSSPAAANLAARHARHRRRSVPFNSASKKCPVDVACVSAIFTPTCRPPANASCWSAWCVKLQVSRVPTVRPAREQRRMSPNVQNATSCRRARLKIVLQHIVMSRLRRCRNVTDPGNIRRRRR